MKVITLPLLIQTGTTMINMTLFTSLNYVNFNDLDIFPVNMKQTDHEL